MPAPSVHRLVLIACAALLVLAVAVAAAPAVVPPKNCGRLTVGGKPYQVKVDGIRCRTGKTHARRYLARRAAPSGYRCRTYPERRGRVRFYCNSGRRVVFAIRR